jgi:hypothetical protein
MGAVRCKEEEGGRRKEEMVKRKGREDIQNGERKEMTTTFPEMWNHFFFRRQVVCMYTCEVHIPKEKKEKKLEQ